MKRPRGSSVLRREHVPALVNFARGYLHEDFVSDYGSAQGAVTAFLADASKGERQALAHDLARLAREVRSWSLMDLQAFVAHELRSAWRPESADDLATLIATMHGDG